MKQLKVLTFKGQTSFYYKVNKPVKEADPKLFWQGPTIPFGYLERSSSPQKSPQKQNRNKIVNKSALQLQIDVAKQLITSLTPQKQVHKYQVPGQKQQYSDQQKSYIDQNFCKLMQKTAQVYSRKPIIDDDKQYKHLQYNNEYINEFYNLDFKQRNATDLSLQSEINTLKINIQTSKNQILQLLTKYYAIEQFLKQKVVIKIEILESKNKLNYSQSLSLRK
ncbi:hypothetical protein SS50377_23396 [Spironucleus salmonicida]|uniref:Uncharacterized protein n=1 Tax=Spironucleus salmonicida TaxID=348837 RepID=V6LRI3_9EUKA|nr:hypothetical protein SS50377_23396 [Spironucleus salmonicida]|eukprot:EST47267.1 Hypothetical protein SS50377_12778 [Spironucleus salmonicida]